MPKEIEAKKFIPALYKRGFLETLLFGHINCVRHNMKGTTIEQAVIQFRAYYGLSEEDWPLKTATRMFQRMNEELIESQKTIISE